MLPRDHDIKNLALYAPRIAYALLIGVPRVPFSGLISAQFTSSAVDATPVVVSLQNNLTQDTLIERVTYTVFQQNSFSGSPLQSLYFAMLKQCTGVGVMMQVFGGPKYNVDDVFTPLEDVADEFAITWPNGWPLAKQSNVKCSFVLQQTPTSVPYDVDLCLCGWQFLDKAMDDLTDDDARKRLKTLGFEVPNFQALAQDLGIRTSP